MAIPKIIEFAILRCLIIPLSCYCLIKFTLFGLISFLTGNCKRKEKGHVYSEPACLRDNTYGEHGYIELKKRGGLTIHYVANGDRSKPLMLFIHGFPEFWYMWKEQLVEFGKDYYAVAIDLPGYGNSTSPKEKSRYKASEISADVEEFILALGYESCILVGHDWGALIAFHTAIEHPNVVNKLINMNVPHKKAVQDAPSFTQLLRSAYVFFFQLPYIPECYLSAGDYSFLNAVFQKTMKAKNFTDEEVDIYKYMFQKSGFTGPLNYYRNLLNVSKEGSGNVKMPSILIWGTEDTALGIELAAASEKYLEKGKVVYVDGASHFVNTCAPEEVHKHMREFLAE